MLPSRPGRMTRGQLPSLYVPLADQRWSVGRGPGLAAVRRVRACPDAANRPGRRVAARRAPHPTSSSRAAVSTTVPATTIRCPSTASTCVAQLHGWVILFTEDFLLAHPGDRDALATLGGCPGLRVSAGAAPRIASLVAEMVREYGERADGFTSVLQAQLHILIAQALRLPGASGPAPDTGRTSPVAREFAALLARPGAAGRTVRSDAEIGPAVGSRALHEAREPTAGALCPAGPCAGPPDQRQRTPPDAALVTSPSRRRDWRESRRRSGRGPWARRSARRSRRYRRRPARWWSP